jgi:hypothetical protein
LNQHEAAATVNPIFLTTGTDGKEKAYLVDMRANNKVHFVCFETTLDKDEFIKRWKQYTRSSNSNIDVTLQQSYKNGVFKYVAQHRFANDEIQFMFSKYGRTSRIAQERISTVQTGGYIMTQGERLQNASANESKIFIFIPDPSTDLNAYKTFATAAKLNIYDAYYENCKYAYILEYFIKTKDIPMFTEQLKAQEAPEFEIYKECRLPKILNNDATENFHVWPSF